MRKYAFTIVELLVVVFILFVLAAILFPVFIARPGGSYRGSCQANLKQIALGFKQYVQDYDTKYPVIAIEPASSAAYGAPYGWGDALQPYLKSWQIFQCQTRARREGGARIYKSWEPGITDYYVNLHIAGIEEDKFPNSPLTVMLGEGNDGLDVNDARYAHESVPPMWTTNPNSPTHRHLDGCNYAFLDGHVKWLPVEKSPGTGPLSQGRFTFAR